MGSLAPSNASFKATQGKSLVILGDEPFGEQNDIEGSVEQVEKISSKLKEMQAGQREGNVNVFYLVSATGDHS